MDSPLLQTKFYIPPVRSEVVPRPRLIERLNEGMSRKLALVSAPAGFGKTTIVSDWIRQSKVPVTWLSLDEGDNDPTRFLIYFITALQQIEATMGQTAQSLLESPQPPSPETLMTALINEIAAFPNKFALVLDDYHVIESPPIDQALTFLLDHLPPQMHMIIATRTDPSLPLSRLRARGQITELRADDLRFTFDEITIFLDEMMGLDLSPEHVAALEIRTEGWITGLQLAALSMQGLKQRSDIAAFINSLTGSHRYIIDYLADEVLQQRPPGTKDFLLQTSILNRLSGPLCDAVIGSSERLGEGSSQTILEALEAANLFIVPLDNERRWYRYHHLFADLLRNRLEASQPDLVPTLHRRASTWFADNGLRSEAIDHSLAAKDWERVTQLIDQIVNDVLGGNEYFTTILGWLDALPKEVIRTRPRLGVVRAWMLLLMLHTDAAESCLRELERAADGQLPDEVRLQVTAIRAFLARQQNDGPKAIELSHQVLEALAEGTSAPALVRPMVALNLANAHRMMGDVVEAQRWFSEVLAITHGAGITLTLAVMSGQASAQIVGGQLRQAAETYQRGLDLAHKAARQSSQAVPAAAFIHPGLGDLLREWNKLDEAAHHLAQGLELARQWQIGMSLTNGYIFQARLSQARGDIAGALDMIQQAEQLPPAYHAAPRYSEPVAACRARLMLAQAGLFSDDLDAGYLEAVEQWVEAGGLKAEGPIRTLDDEHEYLTWVRLLIAQNKPEQALQLLTRLLQAAESGGRKGRVIEIFTLQALAQQALGETGQALKTLERALSLAEPEGYVRLFVDEGRPMAKLLGRMKPYYVRTEGGRPVLSEVKGMKKYISQLLNAFGEAEDIHPSSLSPHPLVDPLSDRELDVLRLLNTDLSGPEIAEELMVSVNTAKTHLKNIYSKLNAHSRYEALERAKQLGLRLT